LANQQFTIGVIGARGYAGAELIRLIESHPNLSLAYAASRSLVGQSVPGTVSAVYQDSALDGIGAIPADAVVLAVPDGAAREYAERLTDRIVVDLSSDHRFDDAWVYGLSEINRERIPGSKRISNPGCYATALQLAAHPLLSIVEGPIHAFGVSGYSGAGTTPSERNDPDLLAGGVTPYKLVGHTHEREATHQLGHPVRFTPHVAPFFRGITLTLQATSARPVTEDDLLGLYQRAYGGEGMVELLGSRVPRVQEIAEQNGARIGGVTVGADGRSIAAVCVIDNLLKGASAQAIQNLNLSLGLPMNTGLNTEGGS